MEEEEEMDFGGREKEDRVRGSFIRGDGSEKRRERGHTRGISLKDELPLNDRGRRSPSVTTVNEFSSSKPPAAPKPLSIQELMGSATLGLKNGKRYLFLNNKLHTCLYY